MENQRNDTFIGINIKPEKYIYVGDIINFSYPCGDGDYECEFDFNFQGKEKNLEQAKAIESSIINTKTVRCDCCNHNIKRGCFFENIETDTLHFFGTDCSNSVMKYKYDVIGAKKQTLATRRKREKINKINLILSENDGLQEALEVNHNIIRSIATNFYKKYFTISDKQIELVHKLAKERIIFETNAKEIPEGKVKDVEVTVTSLKIVNKEQWRSQYDKNVCYKEHNMIIITHLDGWKAYGRLHGVIVGDKIKVSGTITKSDKDPYFGFIKRIVSKDAKELFTQREKSKKELITL